MSNLMDAAKKSSTFLFVCLLAFSEEVIGSLVSIHSGVGRECESQEVLSSSKAFPVLALGETRGHNDHYKLYYGTSWSSVPLTT